MRIAMANDHAGHALKEEIKEYLQSEGHEIVDFGTYNEEACDLSDFVYPAAVAVGKGSVERGIFVDGVGYGSAMIANKIHGVYAAVCQDPFCAQLARQHTDSNVLCIGGKIIGSAGNGNCKNMDAYRTSKGNVEKYARRVQKVKDINDKHLRPLV